MHIDFTFLVDLGARISFSPSLNLERLFFSAMKIRKCFLNLVIMIVLVKKCAIKYFILSFNGSHVTIFSMQTDLAEQLKPHFRKFSEHHLPKKENSQ